MIKTTLRYRLISALLAMLLWGSWAYYINANGIHNNGLQSGLAQGITSFIITLLMVEGLTWLYNRLTPPWQSILPTVVTMCTIMVVLVSIHQLAGTPHIMATIGPSLSVGLGFCLFTTYQLRWRGRMRNP